MLISQLNADPLRRKDKNVTVAGVVRATYQTPFAFFTIEDATGTMFCRTNAELPLPGAHIKVDGKLFIGIPEGCSLPLMLVDEKTRSYVAYTNACDLNGCEFATKNSQEIAA